MHEQTPETKELDEFELALVRKKEELATCQREKSLTSCLPCEQALACALRKEYVEAVYRSMHKDKGGGFEF